MVTSNLPFGRWGEASSDDVVAAAVIDRLVHQAESLTLTGDSYRTSARRELLAKSRSSDWPIGPGKSRAIPVDPNPGRPGISAAIVPWWAYLTWSS